MAKKKKIEEKPADEEKGKVQKSAKQKAAEAKQEADASVAKDQESESSDSDDDSDSDDSSSGDVDIDAETAQQLMALEHELQSNPSYDKHLQYIALLRSAPGLRARLRDAHVALSASFPLSEELWLAWVNDELAGVSGPEDVAWLLGLLRRAATRDYLAPAVWELYLDTTHDLDPEVRDLQPAGVDRYRGLCEEALAAAGLHLAAGHRLWEKYRKYELAVEAKLAGGAKAGASAAAKQQDRVRALYQRQLQVPLQDTAQTLEEYKAWEAGHGKSVPPHVAKAADKARDAAEVRAGCEAGVAAEVPTDVAKLGAFLSYIKMEQKAGDTARVQVVYERAVAAFPLTHSLWLQYGQYMETHTKLPGPINSVYERAVRNCPWIGAVWERAIRALDLTGSPKDAVDEMYDRALKAGLQNPEDFLAIILARLDYLRRLAATSAAAASASSGGGVKKARTAAFAALREGFKSAGELMTSHFPEYVDRTLRLPAYLAHCEAVLMDDLAAAREVWEGALKGAIGRYAEAWEAYISMERERRALKEARALYKRCYSRRCEEDGQLRLCHAWLRFEREEGSADDYLQALLKVEPILEESAAAAAAAADQGAAAAAQAAVQKAKILTKEEMKALRQAADPNFKIHKKEKADKGGKPGKRQRQEGEGQEVAAATGGDHEEAAPLTVTKRVRTQEPDVPMQTPGGAPAANAAAGQADADAEMADHDNAAAAHRAAGSADGNGDAEGAGSEEHQAGPGPGTDAAGGAGGRPFYTDNMTVFIKGLKPRVRDGEFDAFLKQHLPEGLKEIRVVRDHTGQAKGFAYVECSSREALDKLVALNQTNFQGWNLFIAESKPPSHGPGGRGAGGRGRFTPRGGGGFMGGGRGRFGRGYGRGSDGGSGHGSGDGDEDTEMADAGPSRGFRGGHSWGGGGRHPGLGHPTGRGKMRTHLEISDSHAGTAPPTALVPRSVQMAQGAGGGEATPGQPMSNDDFRKMLFGSKK